MKIIAKQYPFDWHIHEAFEKYSFQDQNFVIEGNNRLSPFYNSEIFQNVKKELENGEVYEALNLMEEEGYCWFLPYEKYSTQIIQIYFPKENGKKYNAKELLTLKRLLRKWEATYKDDVLLDILTIVTGKKWEMGEIKGCTQGDWNNIFYVKNEIDIENIEARYFGLWTEWEITDDDGDVTVWQIFDYQNPKEYLAECFGVKEKDIELLPLETEV